MKTRLSQGQQELLLIAKEKGFLITNDFKTMYSGIQSIKTNIERFILLGHLEATEDPNKFNYIGDKNE